MANRFDRQAAKTNNRLISNGENTMATKQEQIEEIHNSLVNGQRTQMVKQIDEYGLYDFWADYRDFLESLYSGTKARWDYFFDATVSYNRIKCR